MSMAGFRQVGGASRPPKVPLTGSVRGEEQRGEGVVVDGEWSRAGDRRGPSLAHWRRSSGGGGRSGLREGGEEEMQRRERESRELERELGALMTEKEEKPKKKGFAKLRKCPSLIYFHPKLFDA